jgi:hypothetical protein
MKTVMGGSPDRLDAVIYATLDLDWLLGNPVNQMRPGTEVRIDPQQLMEMELEARSERQRDADVNWVHVESAFRCVLRQLVRHWGSPLVPLRGPGILVR